MDVFEMLAKGNRWIIVMQPRAKIQIPAPRIFRLSHEHVHPQNEVKKPRLHLEIYRLNISCVLGLNWHCAVSRRRKVLAQIRVLRS